MVTGAVEATDPQSGHTIVFSKVIDIVNEKITYQECLHEAKIKFYLIGKNL